MARIILHIPEKAAEKAGMPVKVILEWTTEHAASSYNLGVLLIGKKGVLFDGFLFRYFRDKMGAYIETDRPNKVRAALGLAPHEAGIVASE